MKVGIVTLTHNPNFGNTLQNIALTKALEKYDGVEVETIFNKDDSNLIPYASQLDCFKMMLKCQSTGVEQFKRIRFEKVRKQYIKNSTYFWQKGKIDNIVNDEYDLFIAGSDQVWNPSFGFAGDFEFLRFADPEKRGSYAASVGISSIDVQYIESFRDGIKGMKYLSFRETQAAALCKGKFDVSGEVHIDPTMLCSAEEWKLMMRKPFGFFHKNYILVYLLGENQYGSYIKEVAAKFKAAIVNLSERKYSCIDPLEFVWIIANARFMVTDSFHGTVFSILMNIPFTVCQRVDQNMEQNSRFDTLLNLFHFEKRMCNYDIDDTKMSFNHCETVLDEQRAESNKYILMMLEGAKKHE